MFLPEEEMERLRQAAADILNDPIKLKSFLESVAKDESVSSFTEGEPDDQKINDAQNSCDHGVVFDEEDAKKIGDSDEIRKKYPRGWGVCPKGCGYNGIAYASYIHYLMGDW